MFFPLVVYLENSIGKLVNTIYTSEITLYKQPYALTFPEVVKIVACILQYILGKGICGTRQLQFFYWSNLVEFVKSKTSKEYILYSI